MQCLVDTPAMPTVPMIAILLDNRYDNFRQIKGSCQQSGYAVHAEDSITKQYQQREESHKQVYGQYVVIP